MAQTTYSLPAYIGTYSNGDAAWLTGLGLDTITLDPVTPNNNYATCLYSIERRPTADTVNRTPETGTSTVLIDPATSPGCIIQAVRDAESITA